MRVFVTGASGFIGSHVVHMLLERGTTVAVLLSSQGNRDRLQALTDLSQLTVIEGRLDTLSIWEASLAHFQPTACIHLAWYAEPGKYLHAPENTKLLQHSLDLLQALIRIGCGQIVMVGTCAEYNTDLGFLSETSPARPATIYAATKLALGQLGAFIAEAAHTRFAWARLFYLYGPYEDKRRLITALIDKLERGEPFPATLGEQVRDYLHVEDVASALCSLVEREANGVFNISSNIPITMRQLMETVGDLIGHAELIRYGEVTYRKWEPRFVCGDNQKLRQLGWAPKYTLRQGLEATVKWWECQHNSHLSHL
jgi:nucleoside-diphosphate-sugar epimerase